MSIVNIDVCKGIDKGKGRGYAGFPNFGMVWFGTCHQKQYNQKQLNLKGNKMSGSSVMVRLQLSVQQIQEVHNLLNQTDPREQPIALRELGLYLEKQLSKMNAGTLAASYVKSGPRESAIQSGDAFGFTKVDKDKELMEALLNESHLYSQDMDKDKRTLFPGRIELARLMDMMPDYFSDGRWTNQIQDMIMTAYNKHEDSKINMRLYGTREEQDKVADAFAEAAKNTPRTSNPFDL